MKLSILVTLIALAVWATSSAAARPTSLGPVADARVAADLVIARDYWQRAPDCAGYGVFRAQLPWHEAAEAEQPGCRIWLGWQVLARDRSPAALKRREDAYLCVVVVHEYGHSLGFGHVHDRRSVMFDGVLDPRVVPACGRMLARPRMTASARGAT